MSLASSLYWSAGDVIESIILLQREWHAAPGVAARPCYCEYKRPFETVLSCTGPSGPPI